MNEQQIKNNMYTPNYRVVYFGNTEYGFWNNPRFFSELNDALAFYQDESIIADGCVLIQCNHEDWKIIREWSCYDYEVYLGTVNNFRVRKLQNVNT